MVGVNILKSASDISSFNTSGAGDMAAKSTKLEKAQEDMLNPAKHNSRNELDASGLSRKYDEMQKTFLNVKSQDTTSSISHSKLNNEKNALDQVNKIMVKFESEMSLSNSAAGSNQDKVNRALASLEVALRSKDTSGNYVWGGKDPTTDPLSRLDSQGNRVSVSLVKESNIVNGLITNNYSLSTSNDKIVTVSSEHEIRESFIYPGHEAIAKAIGYLNMIKENTDAVDVGGPGAAIYTDTELAVTQRSQIEARGEIWVQVDLEVHNVKNAFDINKRDVKNAMQEKNDLFSGNLIDRTQKVKDLLVSLGASITLSNVMSKISDKLSDLRV